VFVSRGEEGSYESVPSVWGGATGKRLPSPLLWGRGGRVHFLVDERVRIQGGSTFLSPVVAEQREGGRVPFYDVGKRGGKESRLLPACSGRGTDSNVRIAAC